jgi:integrase
MSQIDRAMVSKRYADMRDKGLRGNKGAPAQAAQCMSVLKAMFNYAIREYRKPDGSAILTDNPCDVLHRKMAPLKPKTTRVPDDKLGAVWSSLKLWHSEAYNRDTASSVALVMLLLATGLRKMEGAELTWDRVNLDEGWLHLPDPKNRNPVWIPLSTQMVELLTTRQKSKVDGNPFVFPSWGKAGHIVDPRDTMSKVSKVAGLHLSPHDLRRTFTTIGIANCGIDFFKIELLTNHVPRGVTAQHYLETSKLQYLQPETQRIGDYIEAQSVAYEREIERDTAAA